MDIASATAAKLYTNARSATAPSEQGGASLPDFATLAGDLTDTLQTGEATAKAAMAGKADTQSLVQALASSELAIETAVTLRDRVVEAYQEILRMPV